MPDFVIKSLRGGMNNSDSPLSLQEDQCVLAENIEWTTSLLGERRRGCDGITLPPSLSGQDRITFSYRNVPTQDETASELWLLGVTGTASSQLAYKDTTWHDVAYGPAAADNPVLTGFSQYRWASQSLHGKLFFAYDSTIDRLHVWDGTTFRRTGLAEPAAPSVANDGGVGTFSGRRYYRVRYIEKSGSTVLRRSEPSDATTFDPNGNDTGAVVTKPAAISEGETHWEVEASTGGVNFYVIATVIVATTTYTDTTDYVTDYTAFPLSEDIGDYTLLPSARYLAADEDRLLMAGSWETTAQSSRVTWTPVFGNLGAGNDERQEADTDPFVDLDGSEGGGITGLSVPVLGSLWVFKQAAIYKLVRSGSRQAAYQAIPYTKKRGAIHGSVIEGVDQTGNPCIYFLDPTVGPCRVGGPAGVQQVGADIRVTWQTLNIDATKVVATAFFYPASRQVHWCLSTGVANVPNIELVLQTDNVRNGEDGARRGWSLWTGLRTGALTATLYADNIETNGARSLALVPFVGIEGNGLFLQTDTGNDDNGTAYLATITTKPYTPSNVVNEYGINAGALVATAAVGAYLDVTIIRDFGLTTKTIESIPFDPTTHGENMVIKFIDNLGMSELRALQLQFSDPELPGTRWELQMMAFTQTPQMKASGG